MRLDGDNWSVVIERVQQRVTTEGENKHADGA